MERRYLVAILALAATFAIFSREFRSGHLAKLPTSRAQLQAEIACARQYVAGRLMAKLEPYVDRTPPEQAQIMAELNLPEVVRVQQQIAEAQVQLVRQTEQEKCAAAIRAQREAIRAQQATRRIQQLQDLAVIRAQVLAEQATERVQRINVAAIVRAQEAAARSLRKAQCALEESQSKHTQLHGTPLHVSFQVPAAPQVTVTIPAATVPPAPTTF